jgi:hypothetical protein
MLVGLPTISLIIDHDATNTCFHCQKMYPEKIVQYASFVMLLMGNHILFQYHGFNIVWLKLMLIVLFR